MKLEQRYTCLAPQGGMNASEDDAIEAHELIDITAHMGVDL